MTKRPRFGKQSRRPKAIPVRTEIPGVEEWCLSMLADEKGLDLAMTSLSGTNWLIGRFDIHGRLLYGPQEKYLLTTMDEILHFVVHRANQILDGNVGINTTYEDFPEKPVDDFQGYRGLKDFWEGVVKHARNHLIVWEVLNR